MNRILSAALGFTCAIMFQNSSAQEGLYGLTSLGGKFNVGSIYSMDTAGTFNVRHDLFRFDGSNPHAELIEASNGNFYGTTPLGGANGKGVIFQYDPNTGVYRKVHDMSNATGATSYSTLIEPVVGTLYGTASAGGLFGAGVIFELDVASGTYNVLYDFDGANGDQPWGGLLYDSGYLYGMTRFGGSNNRGVLFRYEIATMNYTNLFEFSSLKGSWPLGELIKVGNDLYGTTLGGGDFNGGTLFRFDLGTNIQTPLYHMDNNSGKQPFKGVIAANDGNFYGMTSTGGTGNTGTVYRWDTDLDTLFVIKNLAVLDGRNPLGVLMQANNGLIYGMTQLGGTGAGGTVFSLDITTDTYTVLEDLSLSDGYRPWGGLMQANSGKLYGLTFSGGDNNSGTICEFDIGSGTWTNLLNLNTSDGAYPNGNMIVGSDLKLYGLTPVGGLFNLGVIFSFDPLTNTYEVLHNFDQINDGSLPYGSLIEAPNGKFYGMTSTGGIDGVGVIFSYDPNTMNFVTQVNLTVTNGSEPRGSLMLASNGLMYGMTEKGGSGGKGTIFSYDYNTNTYTKIINLTDAGGKNPVADLVEASDGFLYGMNPSGGATDFGTLFQFDPNLNSYTKMIDFAPALGSVPTGNLIEGDDGLLYGMTSEGGGLLFGTIFSFDPNTTTHNVVHDFDQTDGEAPNGSLYKMPNGTFFGTTLQGGSFSSGVLFKFWPQSGLYFNLRDLQDLDGIFPYGDMVYFEEPGVKVDLKAFLEGPYNTLSGSMDDDLRVAGYIPTTEPFTGLGFVHVGDGGGETIDPAILNVTGNNAIVDWMFVELRDKNDNTSVLSTRSALVQRDGDIVDLDGVSPLEFMEDADDYFVAVRHRNHFGAMTLNTVSLSASAASIDFTVPGTMTFGTDATKDISGTRVLWMGNTFIDDKIKYTGLDNDRDPILVAIGGTIPTATISGYHQEDCSMDGVVKYTGLDNDRDPILVNIGGTIPTNTRDEQLP